MYKIKLFTATVVMLLMTATTAEAWLRNPLEIVDYKPSSFTEQSSPVPFFFTIGDQLKFGDVISEGMPTLYKGRIGFVYVSPDQKKGAFTSEGKLYVVQAGKSPVALLDGVGAAGRSLQPG